MGFSKALRAVCLQRILLFQPSTVPASIGWLCAWRRSALRCSSWADREMTAANWPGMTSAFFCRGIFLHDMFVTTNSDMYVNPSEAFCVHPALVSDRTSGWRPMGWKRSYGEFPSGSTNSAENIMQCVMTSNHSRVKLWSHLHDLLVNDLRYFVRFSNVK